MNAPLFFAPSGALESPMPSASPSSSYSYSPSPSPPPDRCPGEKLVAPGSKDIQVQLVITLGLGLVAFVAFCLLRPRWKALYAARRARHPEQLAELPELPNSFFGWLPAVLRISEDQVLSAAGLDAFVFLAFFKMSAKLFAIMCVLAAVVLEPVNEHFIPDKPDKHKSPAALFSLPVSYMSGGGDDGGEDDSWNREKGHLWAYLVFVYFFTGLTFYVLLAETYRIIKVRQEYLGSQATITDRTFRLSGIPREFRDEDKIKALIEKLEIGRVTSVTVCRRWGALDALVAKRARVLQKLEESWSEFLAQRSRPQPRFRFLRFPRFHRRTQPSQHPSVPAGDEEALPADATQEEPLLSDPAESDNLLPGVDGTEAATPWQSEPGSGSDADAERLRPQVRIWYGPLRLRCRLTDAIDYYTERLRRLDDEIRAARRQHYDATDLAFVTMDSVAACQMAVQAVLDPRPGELLAVPAPAPSDVVWRNTYKSRMSRRLRAWFITVFITGLTIVWLILVASLASLLSLCTIEKWAPHLADTLRRHEVTKALVQTGLPTAVVSLLNVAVPYMYEFLSNRQGLLGQGDVELSLVSKNFFFTFFNIFVVFTVFGAATNFWTVLRDSLHDSTYVAYALASSVQRLNIFYLNFIMLQGLGLFPLRLLEFGALALYPLSRLVARTPRDRAAIPAPPVFSYGFYLPTALLVFILCLVYSVLPRGFLVLLLGAVYFALGYVTYKYQLLYAMDQPQHATGGAWRIIGYRVLLGLAVFQVTMSGYLGANKAYVQATLVLPLFAFTIWYMYFFGAVFEPLTHSIALLSVRRDGDDSPLSDADVHHGLGNLTFVRRRRAADEGSIGTAAGTAASLNSNGNMGAAEAPSRRRRRRTSTLDENREKGLRFVNPSLVVPLVQPWIYQDPPPYVPQEGDDPIDTESAGLGPGPVDPGLAGPGIGVDWATNGIGSGISSGSANSSSSVLSLGDTHIWRNAGVADDRSGTS